MIPKGVDKMSRLFKVLVGLATLAATAGSTWIVWPPR